MAVRRAEKFHLQVLFLLTARCLRVQGIEEFLGHCGKTIDLLGSRSTHSGLLTMPLPESMSRYQNPSVPVNCDIIINFASGTHLLIELYFVDIMPLSGDVRTCNTGLEIFDQASRKYYGSRICMEGWQWEERHREKKQQKLVVQSPPLTLRLISGGPYRGLGFKLHFNQIRPDWPCFIQEFKCQHYQRCVHDDLTCDGWDDCEDFSDEGEEAGCGLLTASEICSLIMGIILLLGAIIEMVRFFVTFRRYSQKYGLKSETKVPVLTDKYNVGPVVGIGRYTSQDSLPSRNSRSTVPAVKRQDSDSDTLDKLDLERGDRYNRKAPDNISERSYQSNSRRYRSRSQGTDATSVTRLGHQRNDRKRHKSSQSSLNRDKLEPVSGIDNPALQNEDSQEKDPIKNRERQSGRDKDRLSPNRDRGYNRDLHLNSDSDYDDRDRRRRRNSRERSRERDFRRKNRYSDEDSESERDRGRRRRSYDRYSDDSDYEYERERRRSRQKYSRDRYDDTSDSDRYEEYGNEKDKPYYRRESSERDKNQHRDTQADKHLRRSSYDDEEDERPVQQRKRSTDRRRSPSTEKDCYVPSRNGNRRSRSRESVRPNEEHRDSSPLPLPPPYFEELTQIIQDQNQKLPPPEEEVRQMNEQNQIPPPSSEKVAYIEQENLKQMDETDWRRSSDDRRERYSRKRWTSEKGYQDSPPKYTDIAPKSAGIIYKEESV